LKSSLRFGISCGTKLVSIGWDSKSGSGAVKVDMQAREKELGKEFGGKGVTRYGKQRKG
jgi:hypothetical protein